MTTVRIYGVVGTPLNRLVYTPPGGVYEVITGISNIGDMPPGLILSGGYDPLPVSLIGTPTQPDSTTLFAGYNLSHDDDSFSTVSGTIIIDIISLTYRNIAYFFGNASFRPRNDDEYFYPHTYSISPALPEGMNFNTSNGRITGNSPVVLDEPVLYTVTFLDPDDNVYTTTVTFYGYAFYYEEIYLANGETLSVFPTISGGTPTNYELYDAPEGISIDPDTGEIYGVSNNLSEINVIEVDFTYLDRGYYMFMTIYRREPIIDCLAGNVGILTPSGYVRIDQLKENDIVVTNKKLNKSIKKIHTIKNYTGDLYIIPKYSLSPVYPTNDIALTANHAYYVKGRWYKPHKKNTKIEIKNPIDLYHIELDNPNDNLVVNGVTMESYKGHLN